MEYTKSLTGDLDFIGLAEVIQILGGNGSTGSLRLTTRYQASPGYIYFLDGVPSLMTPIPDIPFVEEFVHLPLLAHPEPEGILILSGGAGGVIP